MTECSLDPGKKRTLRVFESRAEQAPRHINNNRLQNWLKVPVKALVNSATGGQKCSCPAADSEEQLEG